MFCSCTFWQVAELSNNSRSFFSLINLYIYLTLSHGLPCLIADVARQRTGRESAIGRIGTLHEMVQSLPNLFVRQSLLLSEFPNFVLKSLEGLRGYLGARSKLVTGRENVCEQLLATLLSLAIVKWIASV